VDLNGRVRATFDHVNVAHYDVTPDPQTLPKNPKLLYSAGARAAFPLQSLTFVPACGKSGDSEKADPSGQGVNDYRGSTGVVGN
jgi:hypothetical protein